MLSIKLIQNSVTKSKPLRILICADQSSVDFKRERINQIENYKVRDVRSIRAHNQGFI